ncbi:hypothetical protein HPB48_016228 [Haemaphysalis longicornis]|uniref:Uncharacterized protein n=1 Tax=Haemaphysalis longicornis TaxID=44386 RepID=A0A9J6GI43_HAELO|nr:hypothetical protein HPB48_016228 [Haemaphysalis longicornis]
MQRPGHPPCARDAFPARRRRRVTTSFPCNRPPRKHLFPTAAVTSSQPACKEHIRPRAKNMQPCICRRLPRSPRSVSACFLPLPSSRLAHRAGRMIVLVSQQLAATPPSGGYSKSSRLLARASRNAEECLQVSDSSHHIHFEALGQTSLIEHCLNTG